ncbi:MAG: c-type cytochrome [Pseudomonadales bacterium]|nr:c-type cytochrome [Pseudomonadales bacterium]MDP7360750.1 c-type cytochrome [Pseudomonadales bacterium]MDP7597691.1 c-type cytochrome [Pseudomonadales bacterium]HJN50537.1 c-type cytochrome [Pseudomonadales bacterium]
MTRSLMQLLTIVIGISAAMSVFAAGDPAKGKALFTVCAACHGANGEGNALLNAPVTGGQREWYVIRQLSAFRAGVRGTDPKDTYGMQMRPMAMTLADDQAVADVAAYVASLNPTLPDGTQRPPGMIPENDGSAQEEPAEEPYKIEGDVEAGKAAFVTCAACHGDRGQGNSVLRSPKLANQYYWYIVRQLEAFKSGRRGSHPKDDFGMQMRAMMVLLTSDQQIHDVAKYITTLK